MARPPDSPEYDLVAVVARLRHAKARILAAVEWARATGEAWIAFNGAGAVRRAVAASPATEAALIYERAARDARIMMICRVFDEPRRGALGSDKASFSVCRDLLALPGVAEWFFQDAAGWGNGLEGDRNRADVRRHLEAFQQRIAALSAEEAPSRLQRLRHFRDENIAHELVLEAPRARPLYRDVDALCLEAQALVEHLAFIVEGGVVRWEHGRIGRSSEALWTAVAERYPRRPGWDRREP